MVQKVFGICEAKNGTETDELLQTGTKGHQRIWQNDEKNSNSRGRKSPSQRDEERIEGGKKRITRKEYQRLVNKFEMEGFYGAERIVESRWRKVAARQRCFA